MKTGMIYRVSFYLMLTVATKLLCGDAADSRIDGLLPFAVAGAGVLAFLTVDQVPRWGLPREVANLLAVGTLAILYGEYKSDETQLIRALGHWVACLQLLKYFLPKTSEDDWFLFLLGLTQVLIGSVTNQGDSVGLWLFFWAVLAVWVLGLFFLEREARRYGVRGDEEAGPGEASDPYRGLFDMAYVFMSVRVLALTLVLGGLFFLLLPRQVGASRARGSGGMARHLTGFDEEVKLGQLGEILENDSIVMTVELTDMDHKPVRPAAEPLWRGVTLTKYEKGLWRRQNKGAIHSIQVLAYKPSTDLSTTPIRQVIKLEPNDSPTLFAMRPVLDWPSTGRQSPAISMNPIDGTLARSETRGTFDYEVISDADGEGPQVQESPIPADRRKALLTVEESILERLREIAGPIVEGLPAEGREGVTARARALEAYLRDSGAFGYTLEMSVADPKVDPVLDFLTNRHEGHCEYFASALTLLLRSVGIPARVVNGFKGGDWNEITKMMSVRQKHAHSWVEALIEEHPIDAPLWLTLDPTPGTEREQSLAQVGSMPGQLRSVTDLVRYVWVFYILGYDSARQNRILYEPIAATVKAVRDGYATIWGWAKRTFARLFDFQTWGSFISVRGFVVTFLLGTILVFVGKFAGWLLARAMSWWRGPQDDSPGLTAGILFYRRLTQLLAEYELERTPAETQGEFALRASRFLAGLGAGAQAMAAVPGRIVEAFYRVRFGSRELTPETLTELEGQLDLLEERMRQSDRSAGA
ncbi:DUF3488 and transglutaminase-like domain-containing protein [Aquisphaera insulae]|uniref:DUF3488 and transglutaminase-like domain-containing protein n=1 Tax=Aquisphaera insulae TaxID=2712864 RepID=UPI00202E0325|nr:DUF3488 and transglutaminase-like domain-containing protein [Aquisphaera insulae]